MSSNKSSSQIIDSRALDNVSVENKLSESLSPAEQVTEQIAVGQSENLLVYQSNNEANKEGSNTGSTLFFIYPNQKDMQSDRANSPSIEALCQAFLAEHKIIIFNRDLPSDQEIFKFSKEFIPELEKVGGKRISIISFGSGSALAKCLSLLEPRLIRRIAMIDPEARIKPGIITKIIDEIEKFLPVGLPLRSLSKTFDSRPFLHRLRSPILVARSDRFNLFLDNEADYISKKIPNCYYVKFETDLLINNSLSEELRLVLDQFLNTAVKRPQKNLS